MSNVQSRQVSASDDGMRLDRWFRQHYPALGFGALQKMLRTGQIRVDGSRVKANARLEEGQTVRIPPMPSAQDTKQVEKPKKRELSDEDKAFIQSLVIYKDKNIIALNKPPGLACQGGTKTARHVDGLLDGLAGPNEERPRLVHRLDKDTSGVLIVARTRAAAASLGEILQKREAEKIYWTLVAGVPKIPKGKIDLPLIKDGGKNEEAVRVAQKKEDGAKRAVTYYQTMDHAAQKLAWLAMKPVTGRTHQLRVHAAAVGHPIIGDGKYGGELAFPVGDLPKKLHLHARSLTLPLTKGEPLTIEAPLPDHMLKSWEFFGFDQTQRHEPFE